MREEMLDRIVAFLKSIGITVVETELNDECLIPGFDIGPNYIMMDRSRVKYPGDLLHEAGHLAVTAANLRPLIGSRKMPKSWPDEGDEIAAIVWSYGALSKMNIDPKIVFHQAGYKDGADWIIESIESGSYIGFSLLENYGMCYREEKADMLGIEKFPHMVKWLR